MSDIRNRQIDVGRRAIRAAAPMDKRRETTWQYQDRLAAAVRDAIAAMDPEPTVSDHQNGSTT